MPPYTNQKYLFPPFSDNDLTSTLLASIFITTSLWHMSYNLFWLLYLIPLLPVITLIYAFTVKVDCATQQLAFFAQGWNKYHDQNVYKWVKSLRVYQVFFLCEWWDCQATFSEAIFIFGIISIFRTFVFWGSIPYGKIIPHYLNRVVRLTPVIIAKIDSWTGLLVNPRACKVGPLVLVWSLALQNGASETRRLFKVPFTGGDNRGGML